MRASLAATVLLAAMAAAPGLAKDRIGAADVRAAFEATYGELCFSAFLTEDEIESETFTLTYRYEYDHEETPDREVTLYSFFCTHGAYNRSDVYFLVNEHDEIEPLAFAVPEIDVSYVDDDFDGEVEDISIVGWVGRVQLVNAEFDPETQTMTSHSFWRGIGDASSTGVWRFRLGRFVLESYDVDASYDGEINPERIVDLGD